MIADKQDVRVHVAANNLIGSREVTRVEGTCHCGTRFVIEYDDDACPTCGQHYNLMGQELIPPDQREPEYPEDEEY